MVVETSIGRVFLKIVYSKPHKKKSRKTIIVLDHPIVSVEATAKCDRIVDQFTRKGGRVAAFRKVMELETGAGQQVQQVKDIFTREDRAKLWAAVLPETVKRPRLCPPRCSGKNGSTVGDEVGRDQQVMRAWRTIQYEGPRWWVEETLEKAISGSLACGLDTDLRTGARIGKTITELSRETSVEGF